MIRNFKKEDFEIVNNLLEEFNYSITEASFNNEFYNVWVYYDKKIKGVLVFQKIYDRVEIEYIIVENEFRNLGIGSKFLNKLFELNIKNITLEVKESNKTAIKFYKKNGFEIVTIRKNYYKNEDGFLMIREKGERHE